MLSCLLCRENLKILEGDLNSAEVLTLLSNSGVFPHALKQCLSKTKLGDNDAARIILTHIACLDTMTFEKALKVLRDHGQRELSNKLSGKMSLLKELI